MDRPDACKFPQFQRETPLWEAVLFEHAKEGYLGMPAKGGHEEYTDCEIENVAEYMRSLVHAD